MLPPLDEQKVGLTYGQIALTFYTRDILRRYSDGDRIEPVSAKATSLLQPTSLLQRSAKK